MSRWWTGRAGVLQSMGSQRVRHNRGTELKYNCKFSLSYRSLVTYRSSNWLSVGKCKLLHLGHWVFLTQPCSSFISLSLLICPGILVSSCLSLDPEWEPVISLRNFGLWKEENVLQNQNLGAQKASMDTWLFPRAFTQPKSRHETWVFILMWLWPFSYFYACLTVVCLHPKGKWLVSASHAFRSKGAAPR